MTTETAPAGAHSIPSDAELISRAWSIIANLEDDVRAVRDYGHMLVGGISVAAEEGYGGLGAALNRLGRDIIDRYETIEEGRERLFHMLHSRRGEPDFPPYDDDDGDVEELASASKLARLIEAHKIARAVLHVACDEDEANRDEASPAWVGALRAEESALMAICSHRCRSLDEVNIRAQYLSTMPDAKHRLDEFKFIDALLRSSLPEPAAGDATGVVS